MKLNDKIIKNTTIKISNYIFDIIPIKNKNKLMGYYINITWVALQDDKVMTTDNEGHYVRVTKEITLKDLLRKIKKLTKNNKLKEIY